jgi:hypothetical protein
LISLQKKIDGQSLSNMDDVPWYGVGPSDPVPIPVLGPDIIDPRQMELIRQQAQKAARGEPSGIRELPAAVVEGVEKAKAKITAAKTAAAPAVTAQVPTAAEVAATDPEKAERLRKREEALARKRAKEAEKGG